MTAPRRHTDVTDEERERAREISEAMDGIEEAQGGVMPRRGIRSQAGFERAQAERAGQDELDEDPDES